MELSSRVITPEGYLIADVVLCRTGIQEYHSSELEGVQGEPRIIRVYRPASEVFAPEAVASFRLKPFCNGHGDMINTGNIKRYQVGTIGESLAQDGDRLVGKVVITDQATINEIQRGKTQVSCGYDADYDWTAGLTPDGIEYEAVQRNIRGNHLALVEEGRCGCQCVIKDGSIKLENENEVKDMPPEAPTDIGAQIATLTAMVQALTEMVGKMTSAEMPAGEVPAEGEMTGEVITPDMAEIKADDPEAATTDGLLKVYDDAKSLVGAGVKITGSNAKQIKAAALKLKYPSASFDGKSYAYLSARFDAALAERDQQTAMDSAVRGANVAPSSSMDARKKFIARQNGGKK